VVSFQERQQETIKHQWQGGAEGKLRQRATATIANDGRHCSTTAANQAHHAPGYREEKQLSLVLGR